MHATLHASTSPHAAERIRLESNLSITL
jgi:hypothetical protein